MKIFLIWLQIMTSSLITTASTVKHSKSLLAYKRSPRHSRPIAADTDNFEELVRNSDVFVDKTIILEKILQLDDFDRILLSLPKTWGKSINLHMLKTFVELQLDENGNKLPHNTTSTYRLFQNGEITLANGQIENLQRPLHISTRKSICDQFQGKYPVIYVRLGGINGTDYDDFLEIINSIIMSIYRKHIYLKSSLSQMAVNQTVPSYLRKQCETNLALFTKIMENRSNEYDLKISLSSLSDMLYKHHDQRVFILMDDWDSILCNLLFEPGVSQSEAQRIFNFFTTFMINSFKTNTCLYKGVFTGTFRGLKLIPALDDVREYWGPQSTFYVSYGFFKPEVEALFDYLEIPKNSRIKASDWYGGYQVQLVSRKYIYNPRSVSNFVCDKKIRNYRIQRHHRTNHMLKNIFQDNESRDNFLTIILNQGFTWIHYHELRPKYMFAFKEIMGSQNTHKKIDYSEWNDICSYLYDAGYFKLASNLGFIGMQTRIVNQEVKNELLNILMDDYKDDYGISVAGLENAVQCLVEFLSNFDANSEQGLVNSLESLLQTSPRYIMPFIVQYLTSKITMQDDFHSAGMPKDFECNSCRPDDIVCTKEREIIIKTIVESKLMDDIVEHVHHYREMLRTSSSARTIIFMGITIFKNNTVNLYVEVPSPNITKSTDSFEGPSSTKNSSLQTSLLLNETITNIMAPLEDQYSTNSSSSSTNFRSNITIVNTT